MQARTCWDWCTGDRRGCAGAPWMATQVVHSTAPEATPPTTWCCIRQEGLGYAA